MLPRSRSEQGGLNLMACRGDRPLPKTARRDLPPAPPAPSRPLPQLPSPRPYPSKAVFPPRRPATASSVPTSGFSRSLSGRPRLTIATTARSSLSPPAVPRSLSHSSSFPSLRSVGPESPVDRMPSESSSFSTLLEAQSGRDSALAHISEALTSAETTFRRTAAEAHDARTRAARLHDSHRTALQRAEVLEAQARRERAWASDLGRIAQSGEADAKIAEEAMRRADELLVQLRKVAVEEVTRHFAFTRIEPGAASMNGAHTGSNSHIRTISQATNTTTASSTSTIGQWTTPTTSPTSTTGTLISTNGTSPESPWSEHARDRTLTPSRYYPTVPDLNSILEAEQERIASLSSNLSSTGPSIASNTSISAAYATATASPRAPRLEPQRSPRPFLQRADTQLPPASTLPDRLESVRRTLWSADDSTRLPSHDQGSQHQFLQPPPQQDVSRVIEHHGVALTTPIPIPGRGMPSRSISTDRRRSSVTLPAPTPSAAAAFDRIRPGTAQDASARQPSFRLGALRSPIISSAAAYLTTPIGPNPHTDERATGLGLALLYREVEEMENDNVARQAAAMLQRGRSVGGTIRSETPSHQGPGAPRLGTVDLPLTSSPFMPSTPPPPPVYPTGLVAAAAAAAATEEPTTPSSATRGSVSGAWWRQTPPASTSPSERRPRASSNVSTRLFDERSVGSIGVSVMDELGMRDKDEHEDDLVERGRTRRDAARRVENDDPLMPYPVSTEELVPVPLLPSPQTSRLGQARELIANARRAASRSSPGGAAP